MGEKAISRQKQMINDVSTADTVEIKFETLNGIYCVPITKQAALDIISEDTDDEYAFLDVKSTLGHVHISAIR